MTGVEAASRGRASIRAREASQDRRLPAGETPLVADGASRFAGGALRGTATAEAVLPVAVSAVIVKASVFSCCDSVSFRAVAEAIA